MRRHLYDRPLCALLPSIGPWQEVNLDPVVDSPVSMARQRKRDGGKRQAYHQQNITGVTIQKRDLRAAP